MWERRAASVLGALVALCALARGAHDHWAASAAHLAVLALGAALLWRAARGPGLATELLWPLGAWAAVLALSFRGAVNPSESFLRLKDYLAAALLFAAALQALRDRAAARALAAPLVPFFLVEAAVILVQHGPFWPAPRWLKAQVPGTMVNANAAAAFHLLWLPVLAGFAREARAESRARARFWAAGAGACLLGLLLLNSVWALLCLGVGAALLKGPGAASAWVRRRPAAAAAVLAAAAALVAWKLLRVSDLPAGAQSWRLLWWLSAARMLADSPWLGVGPGNFPSAYLAYASGAAQHTLFAHGIPATLAAETGLLGLAAALAVPAAWALVLRRGWARAEARWPFALGAGLFLAYGAVSVSFEYLANLLALAAVMAAAASPAAEPRWRPRWPVLALGAALAVAVVPDLLSPWQAERICASARKSLEGGDVEGALRGFRAAAGLDPRSWEARRGEAHSLASRTRPWGAADDLEAALSSQRRAAELNRLNGALRWELARMLDSAGRRDEALRELGEAARLGSGRARADLERLSKGP